MSLAQSKRMPKVTQFDRYKIVFLHKQGHSQRAFSQKLGIAQQIVIRNVDMWRTKEEMAALKSKKSI